MAMCVIQEVLFHIIKALKRQAAPTYMQDPWLTSAAQQRLANDAVTHAMPRTQHRPTLAAGPVARLGFTTVPQANK